MLNDVLLIEQKHTDVANQIVELVFEKLGERPIIAISGESGSGKSELSFCLAKALEKKRLKSKIMHSDNLYKVKPTHLSKWRAENGFDKIGPNEYNWDTIKRIVKSFKNKEICQSPCVDLVTQQVDQLITDFSGVDVLVMDGLYAINMDNLDVAILIDITYHQTKKAQLRRGKETLNEFRLKVLEAEHNAIQSIRNKATILINQDYQVV